MENLAARLDTVIKAAGIAITGVSIGDPANRATWRVSPGHLQGSAQPIIDAFDPADPVHATAERDAAVTAEVDRRFMAAYSWVLLKRLFPADTDAQTKTKLAAMGAGVVTAYHAQPWK